MEGVIWRSFAVGPIVIKLNVAIMIKFKKKLIYL